jgi:hypothetical protein
MRVNVPRCPKCKVLMRLREALPSLNDMPALHVFQCETCGIRDSVPVIEEGQNADIRRGD